MKGKLQLIKQKEEADKSNQICNYIDAKSGIYESLP